MSHRPLMVYYLGKRTDKVLLPTLINKYSVTFIVNPKENREWRRKGREELINSCHRLIERRQKMRKRKSALKGEHADD